MELPDSTTVLYREQTYRFGRNFLGGLREAPAIRPADELLLNWAYATAASNPLPPTAVYHDRGGVLGICLAAGEAHLCSDNIRHREQFDLHYRWNAAIDQPAAPTHHGIFEPLPAAVSLVLMQVPKSLELFELYLRGITHRAPGERKVAAAFMTRHFSSGMLDVAARYAGGVEQSRAHKKARLLLLSDLRDQGIPGQQFHNIPYREKQYRQYFGVFSAGHIDYATQFLLESWEKVPALGTIEKPEQILDIGCGNGVIGDQLLLRYPEAQLTATDISEVAVRSTRENLAWAGPRASVVQCSCLGDIITPERFDLIVTNPPFHDGHRNDMTTSLDLFRQARKRLSPAGHLVIVANQHLNYATHLKREFREAVEVARNRKFVIYRCRP